MSIPVRVSTPCRYITRRLVTTKCVVSQLSNGHSVSQPTITSQMPQMTPCRMFLAACSQCVELTYPRPERRQRGGQDENDHGPDQPLPVRVAVDDDLLVGGQGVVRIAHVATLGSLADTQMHDVTGRDDDGLVPDVEHSLPWSSMPLAVPTTSLPPGRWARTRLPMVRLRAR